MPTKRTYRIADVITFRFTSAPFGGFSNFALLSIPWGKVVAPTSEHVYQASKFDFESDGWFRVIRAGTPKLAKEIARKQRMRYSREEWDLLRIDKMRMALRWKYEEHPDEIADLFEATAGRPIVEMSTHDAFWGAKPEGEQLVGVNALGRLWMELRGTAP